MMREPQAPVNGRRAERALIGAEAALAYEADIAPWTKSV